MSESPHLGLGYLAPAQAQKHVSVNEAFRRLDALVQLGVIDRTRTAPPASPAEGDRHIVAAGATGAWAGQSGRLAAFLDGAWVFIEPKPGWLAFVAAEGALVARVGGAWVGSLASLDALAKLGVNASADLVNRLVVASAAALFNHAGAGVQVKLNKAATGEVASLLFQNGFSGRAEFGLVGSDAASLKVSPDGASWTSALVVDAATGAVDLPATPMVKLDKFTASGAWTRPSWANLVKVYLVSGGHGGGSGATRGPGVAASGGGGGAPSTMTEGAFLAATLPATVMVTVGAGGAGGAARSSADADGAAGAPGGASAFGDLLFALADATGGGGGGAAAGGAAGTALGLRSYPAIGDGSVVLLGGAGAAGIGGGGANGVGRFCPGAGGGGGVSAADAASGGGNSGYGALATGLFTFATGGAAPGAAGAAGPVFVQIFEHLVGSGSGGGGAGAVSGSGGAGGAGAIPGGGGGGGGAARNGFASGKGGDGARGEVWVVSLR